MSNYKYLNLKNSIISDNKTCHKNYVRKTLTMLLAFKYNFLIITLTLTNILVAQNNFRHLPYLQNPNSNAITILWFSEKNSPGTLSYGKQDLETKNNITSNPVLAEALTYSTMEDTPYLEMQPQSLPFRHRIRIENLEPATTYEYTVTQGTSYFRSSFRTAPDENTSIRFIIYADCETEPESEGKYTKWVDPLNGEVRSYLIDQTIGYQNNLDVIHVRQPDIIFIAGDLVQCGGEQRDWDEFWRHNTDQNGGQSLASKIPIIPALGNHEYYEGPDLDRFNQPGSENAVARFSTYFEAPANNSINIEQDGRYYCFDYGPATFIILDVCNNSPNQSNNDTNFSLSGENDAEGGNAPDFDQNSQQYKWLEAQLIESQVKSLYTFIILHYAPYSVGIHGLPPGEDVNSDNLSGIPVRLLTTIFMQYGVDAVFSGHDEMWERSEISGVEIKPDGSEKVHTIHFYDVGTGGDGLREPVNELDNPYQKFLVHTDVPEVWENGALISGGKHYGHLEVDILPQGNDTWQAILKPIYIFPLLDADGTNYSEYERRIYDDQIILTRSYDDIVASVELTSFSANYTDKGILLSWKIQSEIKNYGFEVQRLIESKWCKVAFIRSNGISSQPHLYEYLDSRIKILDSSTELYYRLKQIDIVGNYNYSKVIHLLNGTPKSFSLYQNHPNPFNTKTIIKYYLT